MQMHHSVVLYLHYLSCFISFMLAVFSLPDLTKTERFSSYLEVLVFTLSQFAAWALSI
jgi:hypothetical protein